VNPSPSFLTRISHLSFYSAGNWGFSQSTFSPNLFPQACLWKGALHLPPPFVGPRFHDVFFLLYFCDTRRGTFIFPVCHFRGSPFSFPFLSSHALPDHLGGWKPHPFLFFPLCFVRRLGSPPCSLGSLRSFGRTLRYRLPFAFYLPRAARGIYTAPCVVLMGPPFRFDRQGSFSSVVACSTFFFNKGGITVLIPSLLLWFEKGAPHFSKLFMRLFSLALPFGGPSIFCVFPPLPGFSLWIAGSFSATIPLSLQFPFFCVFFFFFFFLSLEVLSQPPFQPAFVSCIDYSPSITCRDLSFHPDLRDFTPANPFFAPPNWIGTRILLFFFFSPHPPSLFFFPTPLFFLFF